MTINRGSEWRKWDLHVHTPATLCSDYGGNTDEVWSKYFEELERLSKEKDIKVLGINDYLFIDGYKRVLKYKKEGGLLNVELILPVVEFRLKEFVGNKDLGRINYHIIFADESILPVEQIETHFLSNFRGKGNLDADCPDYQTWGGVITRETLINLGQHIISQTPEDKRTNTNPIDVGFNNLNFELSKILEILGEGSEPNTFLRNKYFKAIGKAEWESFRWEGSALEKKTIVNSTHFIFSASPTIKQANDGLESLKIQGVNNRLLHCSDAHGFATDIANTKSKELGHCFTWIKSQPTFEGLKQIVYEPEERIKIQSDKPDFKEDKLVIDEIQFISKDKKFTQTPIKLSKNLNVIIGGKSSGKSILLYNIARTLLADDKLFKDEKIENKYNFREGDNLDSDFNFVIKTKIGTSQSRFDDEGMNIMPEIKYIPQNYLIKLAEPQQYKTGDSLNKVIRNLIIEDKDSKEKYNDIFITNVQANDKERERVIDNYFEIQNKISDLNNVLKTKSNKEVLEKNIEVNLLRITDLKKEIGLSDEEIVKYNMLQRDLEILNIEKNKISNDYRKITKFNNESENILNDLKRQKDIITMSLENTEIQTEFKNVYQKLDELIFDLDNFISSYEIENIDGKTFFKKDNIFKKLQDEIKIKTSDNDKDLEKYRKNAEVEKQIKSLEVSIEEDRKSLLTITQLNKEVETYTNELKKEKSKLFRIYKKSFREYVNIIKNLEGRVKVLEKDGLIINGRVKFNFPKFRNSILEISHGTYKSYNNWDVLNNRLSALDNFDTKLFIKDIKGIFEVIDSSEFVLLSKINKQHAIKNLLDDYFFDYWEIEYKGDKLGKMSTGKASFVILMLIIGLSELKTPILIDQPEDNLDNRSVSKDLVEYLKHKKKERQIILVTHNPNIVVNADAENIIVANQKGQNDIESTSDYIFDYVNGALEDSFPQDINNTDLLKSMGIREHIADIVEGGKEAFKKREEKYGF